MMGSLDRKTLHYVKRLLEQGEKAGNFKFQPFVQEAASLISIILCDAKFRTAEQKARLKLVTK